jgi:hypothetical protein
MDPQNKMTAGGGDGATAPGKEAAPVPSLAAGADGGGVHAAPPVEEDGGGINAEEEEDDGYSTPTSPRHRLRAPDVCPGAPRLRVELELEEVPSTRMMELLAHAPFSLWACAFLLCVYRHFKE